VQAEASIKTTNRSVLQSIKHQEWMAEELATTDLAAMERDQLICWVGEEVARIASDLEEVRQQRTAAETTIAEARKLKLEAANERAIAAQSVPSFDPEVERCQDLLQVQLRLEKLADATRKALVAEREAWEVAHAANVAEFGQLRKDYFNILQWWDVTATYSALGNYTTLTPKPGHGVVAISLTDAQTKHVGSTYNIGDSSNSPDFDRDVLESRSGVYAGTDVTKRKHHGGTNQQWTIAELAPSTVHQTVFHPIEEPTKEAGLSSPGRNHPASLWGVEFVDHPPVTIPGSKPKQRPQQQQQQQQQHQQKHPQQHQQNQQQQQQHPGEPVPVRTPSMSAFISKGNAPTPWLLPEGISPKEATAAVLAGVDGAFLVRKDPKKPKYTVYVNMLDAEDKVSVGKYSVNVNEDGLFVFAGQKETTLDTIISRMGAAPFGRPPAQLKAAAPLPVAQKKRASTKNAPGKPTRSKKPQPADGASGSIAEDNHAAVPNPTYDNSSKSKENAYATVAELKPASPPMWLHGEMERAEVSTLVKGSVDGTFMVRERDPAKSNGALTYTLTVVYKGKDTHHLVRQRNDLWTIEKQTVGDHQTIEALVASLSDPAVCKQCRWPVALSDPVAASSAGSPPLQFWKPGSGVDGGGGGSKPGINTSTINESGGKDAGGGDGVVAAGEEVNNEEDGAFVYPTDRPGWVYSTMSSKEAGATVANTPDGTYMVRERDDGSESYALTVVYKKKPTHHLLMRNENGQWVVRGHDVGTWSTMQELVAGLGEPVPKWPVQLQYPHSNSSAPTEDEAPPPPNRTLKFENVNSSAVDENPPPVWMHGKISNAKAAEILAGSPDGTFLLRERAAATEFALSVVYKGAPTHHMVKQDPASGDWLVNKKPANTADIESTVTFLGQTNPWWPIALSNPAPVPEGGAAPKLWGAQALNGISL
jgi:hypothetical protein